jgi:hypothetical protein
MKKLGPKTKPGSVKIAEVRAEENAGEDSCQSAGVALRSGEQQAPPLRFAPVGMTRRLLVVGCRLSVPRPAGAWQEHAPRDEPQIPPLRSG